MHECVEEGPSDRHKGGGVWLGGSGGRASGVFLSLAGFSGRGLLFFIIAPSAQVTNGSHSTQTGVDAGGAGLPASRSGYVDG